MVSNLLNFLGSVTLALAVVWLVMALLGLKIRGFNTLRRAYIRSLFRVITRTGIWLWFTSPIHREGGGRIADSSLHYPGEEQYEEVEPWP